MLELNFRQPLGKQQLNIDTTLPGEGVSAIFGVSGAGKTSLLNVIAGLIHPQTGTVRLNGRTLFDADKRIFLPPEKRRIGYVFQDARLFPHYRVRENLLYGAGNKADDQFHKLTELLDITSLLTRYPATLSGGEKQRVAIGRALLSSPELLLMDEPLASLDLPRKREFIPWLQALTSRVNIPVVYVSHNLDEIMHLADQMLILEQGEVQVQGALEEVWNNPIMRRWIPPTGQGTLLSLPVVQHHPQYAMTALGLGDQLIWIPRQPARPGNMLRIYIQAADVSLAAQPALKSSIRNVLAVQVTEILSGGEQCEVKLQAGQFTLWAQITQWAKDELALATGKTLYAQIKSVSLSR